MSEKKPIRFSDREKQVIYSLFHKYKDIIDYRYRKNSTHKQAEVRDCWLTIQQSFNQHPDTASSRTLKQIQKFWLNSKLRNRFPSQLEIKGNSKETDSSFNHICTNNGEQLVNISEDDNVEIKFLENSSPKLVISSANSINRKEFYDENELRNATSSIQIDEIEPALQEELCPDVSLEHNAPISFDQRMNLLRLQEMEYRVRESKHRSILQQVALLKAKEELKQMRIVHQLQIEEMKIKLDTLKHSTFK